MINVHIIDDHKMVVEGLTNTLQASGKISVTGFSYTIADCRKAFALQRPDVLLLDLKLEHGKNTGGLAFCKELLQLYPEMKILILSFNDECSVVRRVLDAGAHGYILKNTSTVEVIAGIEAVMRGEIFLCEETERLLKKEEMEQPPRITAREEEVLALVVAGFKNQDIADKLGIGIETVKAYRRNLRIKLDANNVASLVYQAHEKNLINY
jgi:DNA-binding NarL/FixJ family response regulator